jgi:hypothetical protein
MKTPTPYINRYVTYYKHSIAGDLAYTRSIYTVLNRMKNIHSQYEN